MISKSSMTLQPDVLSLLAGGLPRPSTPQLNPLQVSTCRPPSAQSTTRSKRSISGQSTVRSRPPSAAITSTEELATTRALPNDAIFNTQFTSAGRRFLSKVKKNRAMQVDRRTKGFHAGLEARTVIIDSISKRHYRVLILDPDLQRREDLADDLERYFEVLVAPSNERAFTLLGMFKVDFILVFVGAGNDKTITSSPALAFLREMKKKCFSTPAAALITPLKPNEDEQIKLLQRALHQGGLCGFFEVNLPREVLIERLAKLLHSLVVAQEELRQSYSKSKVLANSADEVVPAHAMKKRTTALSLPGATGAVPNRKPDSITYDRENMLLELGLSQRKRCLQQRRAVTEIMEKGPHSVLGVDLNLSKHDDGPQTCSSAQTSDNLFPRSQSIARTIPPLPSQQEVSKLIYAKPHEIQGKIHRHLYERMHLSSTVEAIPQDPLLHHCIAIDPRTVKQGNRGSSSLKANSGLDSITNAYFLFQERRYDEATVQCDRTARTQSGNLIVIKLAMLLRGVLFDTRGEFSKAECIFEKCLSLDPDMHQAMFNLSVSRLKLGKDSEALEAVTSALRYDPGNPQYLQNRALIHRRLGNFAQAQVDYAKLLGGNANNSHHGGFDRYAEVIKGSEFSPLKSPIGNARNVSSGRSNAADGVFDHLFGKPPPDKLALVCAPEERLEEMVGSIVSRLRSLIYFQHFPLESLTAVARVMEFDVVACGKAFTLAEAHPLNFYVLLGGRLSVRRKMGDFALSTVTTHHLEAGMVFGCSGHAISAHTTLIADECAEIGIVWPGDYNDTIHAVSTSKNQEVFLFLQNQVKVFQAFSTSELGHLVGISERRRFRKGEVLLAQNETPKHLVVLWKGSCAMYQDFSKPPLARVDNNDPSDSDEAEEELRDFSRCTSPSNRAGENGRYHEHPEDDKVLPFHRHLAKPNWPLGFQTRVNSNKSRRYLRGGRRNGMALGLRASSDLAADAVYAQSAIPAPLVLSESRLAAAQKEKYAHVHTFTAPAIFGESAFLDQQHAPSKCTIVAESLVEALLFEHSRLQEMELTTEVVLDIVASGPKYVDEDEVATNAAKRETWNDYKSKRMLELSKRRWPEAKKHLRMLSNGCSIILSAVASATSDEQPRPATSGARSSCCKLQSNCG